MVWNVSYSIALLDILRLVPATIRHLSIFIMFGPECQAYEMIKESDIIEWNRLARMVLKRKRLETVTFKFDFPKDSPRNTFVRCRNAIKKKLPQLQTGGMLRFVEVRELIAAGDTHT